MMTSLGCKPSIFLILEHQNKLVCSAWPTKWLANHQKNMLARIARIGAPSGWHKPSLLGAPSGWRKPSQLAPSGWRSLSRRARTNLPATQPYKQDQPDQPDQTTGQTGQTGQIGLNAFLGKVFKTTGTGICTMLGTSALCCVATMPAEMFVAHMAFGTVGSLACAFALDKIPAEFDNKDNQTELKQNKRRTAAFFGLCSSMGIMMSPAVHLTLAVAPMAVPLAGLATVLTMSGAFFYAQRAGDKILTWQPALAGSLWGIIGISLSGLGAYACGFHNLANALFSVETCVWLFGIACCI